MNKNIKFIDLFAGIGGFHKAIKNIFAGSRINLECVLVSEIDEFAKRTYSKNYKWDISDMHDINKLEVNDIKDFDVLFAGFPCQAFSNAGKKLGFEDEIRGKLIFKVIEIIETKKPNFVLLENVNHIVNHDSGKTWDKIISTIKEIGYITTENPLIISPTDIGEPQQRKRVFMPFIKKDLVNIKEIKNKEISNVLIKDPHEYIQRKLKKQETKYVLSDINQNVINAWKEFVNYFHTKKIYKLPVIWLEYLSDFNWENKIEFQSYPDWKKQYIQRMNLFYKEHKEFIDSWMSKYNVLSWPNKRDKKLEWQADNTKFEKSFIQFRQSGVRCKKPTFISTLVAMVQVPIVFRNVDGYEEKQWTYLTPREISKFQGFDDNFKICDNDHQAYKQFGNCVNVKVVEYIIENYLKEYILKSLEE